MAHLWISAPVTEAPDSGNERDWTHVAIAELSELRAASITPCGVTSGPLPTDKVFLFPHHESGQVTNWALLAPVAAAIRINEWQLTTGIHALRDRDAIQFPQGDAIYFSTETLPCIEAFSVDAQMHCARCKLPITQGSPAVRCTCGVWHHEDPDTGRACFSYAQTCAICDQSTDLGANEFNWSPRQL